MARASTTSSKPSAPLSLKDLTFRGQRTVRETMRKTGKRVRFEVEGESLSLDKTIVEALYDPISHQLRNAVAHGIESPRRTCPPPKARRGGGAAQSL